MTDKSDEFLFAWVVAHAGHNSRERRSRWVHVKELFGLGSTSATALCRRFEIDPYEAAGGCPGWDDAKDSRCGRNMLCIRCDLGHEDE